MLQGEGDQVETDEELIPDHDMLHCYPPAPSSSSPLPHVPHVEPEWHPPLPVEQTIQALTPSTELNSGSSMRLAPLLLAAITSTTSTSTRDESATRRIPTICGGLESEEFSTSSNHCREEASEEARPEGRQNPIGRKVRLEQGRTCGSSGSMGTGLREPHADEGRGSLSGRKRTWPAASVRNLLAPHPLCPGARSEGDLQICRLARDVTTAVASVTPAVEHDATAREQLNTKKAVSIKGAKESLKARLQKLETKSKHFRRLPGPQSVPKPTPPTSAMASGAPMTDLQKKVPKRDHEKPAKEVETEGWVEKVPPVE